eukprot:7065323-Pyramimonas_sp.AAC.1
MGLIKKGSALSDRQAKINLHDLGSPEAAQEWIEAFKSECRDRPDGSKLIHPGSWTDCRWKRCDSRG